MQDTIQLLVTEFWRWIGITLESIEIIIHGEDINITIQTPDSALVIGMHGKSLEAFTHILSRMIEKVTWWFVRVHLEVNDYIKSKEEKLFRFLDSKIAFILSTGKSVHIPNLNSYDRKKAHNYISEKNIAELTTHSEWLPSERILVLEYVGSITPNSSIQKWIIPSHNPIKVLDNLSEDGIGI